MTLTNELLRAMAARKLSVVEVAMALGVSPSTIHRSLQTSAFSRRLKTAVRGFIDAGRPTASVQHLLQKSLRLLELSDKLRLDAEKMISLALDQPRQTQ